jgi:hypothetical protein
MAVACVAQSFGASGSNVAMPRKLQVRICMILMPRIDAWIGPLCASRGYSVLCTIAIIFRCATVLLEGSALIAHAPALPTVVCQPREPPSCTLVAIDWCCFRQDWLTRCFAHFCLCDLRCAGLVGHARGAGLRRRLALLHDQVGLSA